MSPSSDKGEERVSQNVLPNIVNDVSPYATIEPVPGILGSLCSLFHEINGTMTEIWNTFMSSQ